LRAVHLEDRKRRLGRVSHAFCILRHLMPASICWPSAARADWRAWWLSTGPAFTAQGGLPAGSR
jgi:hypothetical protein